MGNGLRMRKTLVKHLKNTVPESVILLTTSGEKNVEMSALWYNSHCSALEEMVLSGVQENL